MNRTAIALGVLAALVVGFSVFMLALSNNNGCMPWQTYQPPHDAGMTRYGVPVRTKARCD